MPKEKQRVFIDTNAIMDENYFRSARSSAFLKAAKFLGIEVIIPEIVMDETLGNLTRALKEKLDRLESARRALSALIELDENEYELEDELGQLKDNLEDLLNNEGVLILPYPKIALKEIVEQSYVADKPFKATGEGHKDFIIWHTMRGYIEKKKGKGINYFITQNSTDFCDKSPNDLHPSLVNKLTVAASAPAVFVSLKAFFDQVILPMLPGLNQDDITALNIDIKEVTQKTLEEHLDGRSLYGIEGLPFSNDVTIMFADAENAFEEMSVKEIDASQILISVTGNVEIEAHGFIDKSSYYGDEMIDSKLFIIDGDHNDHVMAVGANITTPFELSLTYDKTTRTITGSEVDLVNEIHYDIYG